MDTYKPSKERIVEIEESAQRNLRNIKDSNQSVEDAIGMILSNRVDYGHSNGGLVSVKQFDKIAKDLIFVFPQISEGKK